MNNTSIVKGFFDGDYTLRDVEKLSQFQYGMRTKSIEFNVKDN
jgi:hypothetical protein